MSDYDPAEEGGGPPETGPDPDVGQAVDDGQPTEQSVVEEPKNYLDVDEVADRYVRVKVDGQDVEVPLQEALSGYSRTADYTRKTQQLAEQRQQVEYALAVQRALQAQPQATIRLLAEQYGIHQDAPSQSPPPPTNGSGWQQPSYDDGDDDLMDPLEKRINQTQRMVEQLAQAEQQRDADRRLNTAISGLQTKFQADTSTIREVVGTALQAGMGPESFEMIYKNIAYDREQQARAQVMADRQTAEAGREAAKMSSQQLVGNGPSANSAGGPQPGASDGTMSIREAFDAALEQHGG